MKSITIFKRTLASFVVLLLGILAVSNVHATLTVTPANQQGSVPLTPTWTPASDSLIAGLSPTTANGNFSLEAAGRDVDSLTSGGSLTIGAIPPGNNTTTINYVTCGNGSGAGSDIVYTLPASPNGYNLTNITVYGGWINNGRDQQGYTVSYATATAPNTFIALSSVSYDPAPPGGVACATRVSITDSAGGVLVSNVVALQFDFTNPTTVNGYTGYGAITVEGTAASGSHPTVTTADQQGSVPLTPTWTPASDSLIAGLSPTTANGNFSLEAAGRDVDSLTSGGSLTIGAIPPGNNTTTINYVTCGNGSGAGSDIVYTLPASPNGYNLTNITVYGGWINNGRDQQGYTVSYATATAPNTFIALSSVSYDPAPPGGVACATRVSITDSAGGVLVSNVVALQFDFTNPTTVNGYTGYGAITVEGTAASGSHPTVTTADQQGSVPLTPTWTPASDSLIAGLSPTTVDGDFSLEAAGRDVDSLTSGGSLTIGAIPPGNNTTTINYVTCGNGSGAGSDIVYTLPASPNGYNLTNITVYGGWINNGRDQQGYTVSYATATAPNTFIALSSVSYDPAPPGGVACATRVSITDSAGGVLVSNVVALQFDFTNPTTVNGYTGYGAITVEGTAASGSHPIVTTADQQGSLPFTPSWTPASDSLIAGLSPSSFVGNFNVEGSGANVNTLTAGGSLTISQVPGGGGETCSSDYVTCGDGSGAGSSIVYTLPASANGYNLTNITVYGGWTDNGRDQQAYTVWYATAANPSVFTALTSVNYLPSIPGYTPSATCASITDSAGGVLVSNVVALQFDFTNPSSENGYCGYAAITVEGTVVSNAASPVLSAGVSLGGGQFQLTFSGPSGQTYRVLTSTNVALPLASWTVLTSGTFDGGQDNYTDTQATNTAQFYSVVSP